MSITKRYFSTLLALLFICCGSTKYISEKYYEINTSYWNTKPRTKFYLKNGVASDSIVLFNNKNEIVINYKVQEAINYTDLKYPPNFDSNKIERSVGSITRGMNDFTNLIGLNYRPLFEKGEFGISFKLFLWINSDGTVEHAVCLANSGCPPEAIKSIIDDIEGWHFEVEKGTKIASFAKTFNFHVMRHDEYRL